MDVSDPRSQSSTPGPHLPDPRRRDIWSRTFLPWVLSWWPGLCYTVPKQGLPAQQHRETARRLLRSPQWKSNSSGRLLITFILLNLCFPATITGSLQVQLIAGAWKQKDAYLGRSMCVLCCAKHMRLLYNTLHLLPKSAHGQSNVYDRCGFLTNVTPRLV